MFSLQSIELKKYYVDERCVYEMSALKIGNFHIHRNRNRIEIE